MKKAFTKRYIDALKPKVQRYEEFEGNGFGVRVTPKGAKSWICLYHFDGRSRRLTLGRYPAMGLAQARTAHRQAREKIETGVDPGGEKVEANQSEREASTVSELIDDFLAKYSRPNKRTASEDERILEKDVRSIWGRRKVKSIQRKDVIKLLDGVVARGAPIMANRTLACVRRMFSWAVARDIIPYSPCVGIERPSEERRRERHLLLDEISVFWRGLDHEKADLSPILRIAARFCLVTGQRRDEVAAAETDEFNLSAKEWVIPGARTKNKKQHKVPLSPLAIDLYATACRMSAETLKVSAAELLFPFASPSSRSKGHITAGSLTYALSRNEKYLVGKRISPHDLRRTLATHLTGERIGATRFLVGLILNHTDRSVTTHYDLNEYLPEKRKYLDAWSSLLCELIPEIRAGHAENVVPIKEAVR